MLRTLIVEDEFTSRKILNALLAPLGSCETAVDGPEALTAFRGALEGGTPYHLICLDIHMPGLDGHAVLSQLRKLEQDKGVLGRDRAKVIMTTASSDRHDIMDAFRSQADAYLVKPIDKAKLMAQLAQLGLKV